MRFWTAGTAAAVLLAVLSGTAPATASEVSDALRANKRVDRRISQIRKEANARSRALHRAVITTQRENDARPGRQTLTALRQARRNERRFNAWTDDRVGLLTTRRDDLQAWLATWGILRVCPVDALASSTTTSARSCAWGTSSRTSTWAATSKLHLDADPRTVRRLRILVFSPLGGYQVYVRGDLGYVFNAHLIAYGDLGWVRAGTIIGYVGATGDSTAPHDHFEWHPWHGRAVDPYFLLTLVCD